MPSKKEGICDHCQEALYQRPDDNEETIKNRMKVYKENTSPIIEFYKNQGKLQTINADKDSKEVVKIAMSILNA